MHKRQQKLAVDAAPIVRHPAGSTLPVVAALLGSRELLVFTLRVEKRHLESSGEA